MVRRQVLWTCEIALAFALVTPVSHARVIQADPSDFEAYGVNGVPNGMGERWLGDSCVGDTGGGSPNMGRRAVMKFSLAGLSGHTINSAILNFFIVESRKDQYPAPGNIDSVPPFTNPGLGDVVLVHVADYGTPNAQAYSAPSIGNDPGTAIGGTQEPLTQVKVSVMEAVLQALAEGRPFVTFRIQSVQETDSDGLNDVWCLASADNTNTYIRPYLVVDDGVKLANFFFAGTITHVIGNPAPIAVGDYFQGEINWLPTKMPGSGSYLYVLNPLEVPGESVTVYTPTGPFAVAQMPDEPWLLWISNDQDVFGDGTRVRDDIQSVSSGRQRWPIVQFHLEDWTHTAFDSLDLPEQLTLERFTWKDVHVRLSTTDYARGEINTLRREGPPNRVYAVAYPGEGLEGQTIRLSGFATNPIEGDTLHVNWSVLPGEDNDPGAKCVVVGQDIMNPYVTCNDDGIRPVRFLASNGRVGTVSNTTLMVRNVSPTVHFAAPPDGALFAVDTVVSADILFEDLGTNDTHTCVVNWGDGTSGYDAQCSQNVDLYGVSHTYSGADVYTIAATVTDDDGGVGDAERMVVVYDPSAGYVSGEGWIKSPAGAYKADPAMTGKASFGFVSKYRKGATVPDGNTVFVFQAADLNFHSSAHEWLVVSGSSRAQFKGTGTINGFGNYGFLLSVVDMDAAGISDAKDTFRIKIWDKSQVDAVVYDNGVEQPIGGGSIVIRTAAKK